MGKSKWTFSYRVHRRGLPDQYVFTIWTNGRPTGARVINVNDFWGAP